MIELKDVTKVYQNQVQAIHNISLQIDRSEWISFLGPSGSGKSTLLNCIAGIETPTSGEIKISGEKVQEFTSKQLQLFRRSTIGLVFQDFRLLPQHSVLNNIMLPLIPYEEKKNLKQRAIDLLKEVGMDKRGEHLPGELSGGEQQRVAIARSLINQPDILIVDEPTGNLDKGNRDQIVTILLELQKKGHTILMATHDPEIAVHANRKFSLIDGSLQEGGA
ncbi:ABC transporter ATP-binding protein [Radiobacillus sp. PE A8.2]|uniref:ABC transporter ATP-binding protein n=1 Tax=Radiobacillus sp. PE A8.2 TaxID=3380349 RepID=UPI00388EA16F